MLVLSPGTRTRAVAYSPDGRTLAGGTLRHKIPSSDLPILGVAWSLDGSKIFVSDREQTIRGWDARSGDLFDVFRRSGGAGGIVLGIIERPGAARNDPTRGRLRARWFDRRRRGTQRNCRLGRGRGAMGLSRPVARLAPVAFNRLRFPDQTVSRGQRAAGVGENPPMLMAELPRYDRTKRRLGAAEGYLMLGMPLKALAILEEQRDWATMRFEAAFLTGEALRTIGRHREAITALELAAALRPGDVGAAVALGWCYKRTQRLAQAIDALARAARHRPDEPLLHYNLACYWTLAGNPLQAIPALTNAVRLDPSLRANLGREPDFAALQGRADFQRLATPVSDPASPA